ncbi:diguanylate cyclase (GGDEF) domain-containing protein [Xenococcus sp. PCC 7305]|uniref:diguanylate cyclase domain-containing protein n=1 Tax=Xenococcus sp. PCC 7305 TaxID=102125 RepID=UPI0002ABDF96|nr:diguanylate cyclase [Xenococcus sp. PCC 7305]ELS05627.1 diguanylate cyclase (GGDEF) domain-containing protein [Xenococcus sp. PCC 7305]
MLNKSRIKLINNKLNNFHQEQLSGCVLYDQLTGLPNYNALIQFIEQSMVLVKEKVQEKFAVLFIDIDRFKAINSSLGRKLGDKLLVLISRRLQNCLRNHDLISRIGNHEFAIILQNIENIDFTKKIAERIYQEFKLPFRLQEIEIFAGVTIGISIGDINYETPEEILRDAELAVSSINNIRHQDYYQLFNENMYSRAITLLQLENDLRRAIQKQEFELYYQPILSLLTKQVVGFEALIRWQHPSKGLVSPCEFIPLAEETGLIRFIDSWVLREACSQMQAWKSKFTELCNCRISVNVSSKQLEQINFVQQVKQILQESRLNPQNLKLEITESCLVKNTSNTLSTLNELRFLGIELSLDDFGTGYSSLSYLQKFPFNTLKIDRTFVNSINTNNEKLGIIRAIINLASSLNMDTTAEGIENTEQLVQLKALGCNSAQGYLLSKPLNKLAVEALVLTDLENRIEDLHLGDSTNLLEEQIIKEKLVLQIEHLRQEVAELKKESIDLEILLETTTEHADLVESQLHNEIIERQKVEKELNKLNQNLEQLTMIDGLTQIANRRRLDDYLLDNWIRSQKDKAPISLILCDIDFFKIYNDTYGHPIGDYCLKQVALTIESVTEDDCGLAARYGGEEFAVVLPNINEEQAVEIAELIRSRVKDLRIAHQKSHISDFITLSLGVFSMVPNTLASPDLLIACTDKALYEAKRQGRDNVKLFAY